MRSLGAQTPDIAAIREAVRQEIRAANLQEAARQGALAALRGNGNASPAKTEALGPPASNVEVLPGNNITGDPNAPITMIEYSDFQCPYCGKFHRDTYPTVYETYIKPGRLKFAYKHFAFLGQESFWAAQASECAADQQQFWELHDVIFARQSGENQGAFSKDNLIKFAGELKLDTKAFSECLNGDKTLDRVQRDNEEGQRIGVRGTPHFLINGKVVSGAQPFEVFQQAIDEALRAAK